MIRTLYRSAAAKLPEDLAVDEIRQVLASGEGVLWIDAVPSSQNLDELTTLFQDVFHFHPLALDDALHETHLPRVDDWDSYLYIVLHAADMNAHKEMASHELDVFVGRNYLITVHEESVSALDHLWEQARKGQDRRLGASASRLLYALADTLIAAYMPVVDELDEEIDRVEDEVFRRPRPQLIGRIFRIRRSLLRLRRAFGSLREVMNRLARDRYQVIDEADRVYFRDVYDHLVRLYDIVEGLRDVVSGALDSYLGVTSNRINEVMRTLTVVTVLFLPVSFLAGFFGMNFFGDEFNIHNHLPSPVLFWLCMSLMILTPLGMLAWMVRLGMLRPLSRERRDERRPPIEPR